MQVGCYLPWACRCGLLGGRWERIEGRARREGHRVSCGGGRHGGLVVRRAVMLGGLRVGDGMVPLVTETALSTAEEASRTDRGAANSTQLVWHPDASSIAVTVPKRLGIQAGASPACVVRHGTGVER